MSSQYLTKISRKKEELLVYHDVVKLEIEEMEKTDEYR
jgi:hypothetical protein